MKTGDAQLKVALFTIVSAAASVTGTWASTTAALAQTATAQGASPATTASKPSSTIASVDGITVTLAPTSGISIDRKIYNVTSDVRAATGSLSDVLSNLPSVDFNRQTGVSLRGDSSVTILIDGKPAPQLEGAGQVPALDGMPASLVDRIEVMTTPSAEFSSVGSGGVINIVTKKKVPIGPAMTLSAAYGNEGRTRANASVSYNRASLRSRQMQACDTTLFRGA